MRTELTNINKLMIKHLIAIDYSTCYAQPLFTRIWEMPNKNTFDIKCIKKLIYKYFKDEYQSIDPFANKNRIAKITNDLDPEMGTALLGCA
jgi:hypothetical protein